MPLLTKTEAQLLDESLKQFRQTTPVTHLGRGSTARALLEIAAREHAEIHTRLDDLQRDLFVTTATGEALDRIGALLGVTRGIALRGFDDGNNVRFYLDPSLGETAIAVVRGRFTTGEIDANGDTLTSSGFTVRSGTTLAATTGATYTTTDSVTLSGSDVEQFVSVLATGIGPAFNIPEGSLTAHDIKTHQPELAKIQDFILVENRLPIGTGRFSESDEALRFRISRTLLTLQAANPESCRAAVLSVPGVRNVIYVPFDGGLHSFSLVIQAEHPIVSDGVVRAAQQALNQVVAAGNRGVVKRPTYHGVSLKIALSYRPRADRLRVRQLVRRASVQYVNGIGLGEPFILNELIQRVLDVDDRILDLSFIVFARGLYDPSTQALTHVQTLTPANLSLTSPLETWYTSDRLCTICDA